MPEPLSSAELRQKAEAHSDALSALLIKAQNSVDTLIHGEHLKRKAGTGERFWQFRDYTESDRPQDIDWRQSAKGDSVFVRERERQNRQHIGFWCSARSSMQFASNDQNQTKAEAAQIITLALALLFTKGHENVRMIDGDFPAGHSDKALMQMAEHLVMADKSDLRDSVIQSAKPNENMIWIGDFLDSPEDLSEILRSGYTQNSADHNFLIQVLDPAEITLPYEGRCLFQTNTAKERIENVSAIRDAYQERIENHLSAIEKLCTQSGWHYFFYRTDSDITEFLMSVWARVLSSSTYMAESV